MQNFRVLHVDDDLDNHASVNDMLNQSGAFEDFQFEIIHFSDFEEAVKWIKFSDVDFAILDVHDKADKEPDANPSEEDQMGEKLLERIKEVKFFPVVFYTGYSKKVKHLESPIVRVVQKGDRIGNFISPINDLISSGLISLKTHISDSIKNYMWEEVENSDLLRNLMDNSSDDISILLARNLAAKLSRQNVKTALGLPIETLVPIEFYRFPVPDDMCEPGAIVEDRSNQKWMILTPSCDFAQKKANSVLMAKLLPITEHPYFEELRFNKSGLEEAKGDDDKVARMQKKVEKSLAALKGFCKNSSGPERYRFLPGTFFLSDSFVDFQEIQTIPVDNTDYKTLCTLDTPFSEEMLSFFSRYYGRIGTPDLNQKTHWKEFEKIHQLI